MSGRISIDNLSDSLKEMIANSGMTEEQIIELLENEEVIDSLKTDSKSIVGAINELFQSANNGKELIANAIGEPLSSEDTFSAMSTDINGLLSTFKTNMMNNGITVESGDKFKALIDKIATLADSEGKGIQHASGQIDAGSYKFTNVNSTHTLSFNEPLNFTPTYLFIRIPYVRYSSTNGSGDSRNAIVSNLFNDIYDGTDWAKQLRVGCISSEGILNIKSVSSSGFVMEGDTNLTFGYSSSTGYDSDYYIDWYAFGVGEEDTTLRDSLASILGDKGIDVTEEDDMASLISKVDTAFANLVPKKIYLYNRGTEYTTITLGTGNGVQKKESDHLYIDGAYFNGALTGGSMIISYTYNTGDENKYLYLDLNSYGGTLRIGSIYDGVSYTLGGRGLLRLDLSEAPSFTSFSISSTDDVHIYEMYTSNM